MIRRFSPPAGVAVLIVLLWVVGLAIYQAIQGEWLIPVAVALLAAAGALVCYGRRESA